MISARRGFAPTKPATPHQRGYLRVLMGELELPTDQITLLHRRFYEAAGVPEQPAGKNLNVALAELTFAQAAALVGVLKREHQEQRGEDDES